MFLLELGEQTQNLKIIHCFIRKVGVKQIVASISLEGKLCSVILFWLKLVNILPPSDDGVNWDRIASGQNMVEIKFSEEQLYSFLEVEEQELAANTSM